MKKFKFSAVLISAMLLIGLIGSSLEPQTRTFIAEEFPAVLQMKGFTKATLPAAGTAGRLARVTDDFGSVWLDGGTQWGPLSAGIIDITQPPFNAKPDGSAGAIPAFNSAIATLCAKGGGTILAVGKFRMDSSLLLTCHGLSIIGAGGYTTGTTKPTHFDFANLPNGQTAIASSGLLKHVALRNFFMDLPLGTGGSAINFSGVSGSELSGVHINSNRGSTAYGISFGDTVSSANSVTTSTIKNTVVGGDVGTPYLIGQGSTSISLISTYALGGTVDQYLIYKATYISLLSTASDSGTTNAYGYTINASTGVTLTSCGAENNGKGLIKITGGSVGVTLNQCRGAGNNTSADAAIGSFLEVTAVGINYQTVIIGGTDTGPNAATTANFNVGAGNLWTTIIGRNATSFTKGLSGDAIWKDAYLTELGGAFDALPSTTLSLKRTTPTYGPTVAIDASLGNEFDVTATDGAAFTITNPANTPYRDGQRITITIRNASGGALGAVTWDTLYKLAAWTSPANTFSRSIDFKDNGANWVETSRTTVDVPN